MRNAPAAGLCTRLPLSRSSPCRGCVRTHAGSTAERGERRRLAQDRKGRRAQRAGGRALNLAGDAP
eukprot:3866002-Pleurochrysis_carterae.AAC.1